MSVPKRFEFQCGTEGITYTAVQCNGSASHLIGWVDECGKLDSDVYPTKYVEEQLSKGVCIEDGIKYGWFVTEVIEE